MKQQNRGEGTAGVVSEATPAIPHTGKPKKPRLSELPGAIPITDRAGIVAVLNRDALMDALAKVIFQQITTNLTTLQSASSTIRHVPR